VVAAGVGLVLGATELAARLDVRRRRAQRSGLGDLLYRRALGHGPPVVFLAGLQGSTRFWGDAFDAASIPERRLIFVDALGFGRSPWPAVDYTLEDHLGALRRTLLAEGATSGATLVGYSLGALLAAEYAAAYANEVERLVLLGAPFFDSPADARARLRAMSPLAATFSLSPVLARASCQLMCALRPALFRLMPWLLRGLPRAVAQDSVLHHWHSFHGTVHNVLLRTRLDATLDRLPNTIQVTLVHGRQDTVTPLSRIEALSQAFRGEVVLVDGNHRDYLRHVELIHRLMARA
jgi:pimeloyl-ACP methyl ester carboxylesterase